MAVIVHTVIPNITRDQYDAVRAEAGWLERAPDGGIVHMTWWEDGDCHNLDAWESEAAYGAFGEGSLGPAMGKLGIAAEPSAQFHAAHEVYVPNATTVTVS
jgi:hypothetical protein